MWIRRHGSATILGGILLGCLAGCGGSSGSVDTVPVSGTVTFQGQPIADALVTFSPKDGSGLRAAFGRTDDSGEYTLMTVAPGDGAMVGSYVVTVSKSVDTGARGAPVAYDSDSAAGMDASYRAAAAEAKAKKDAEGMQLLPEKYKNITTSDLTADVTDGGDNTFPLVLTP